MRRITVYSRLLKSWPAAGSRIRGFIYVLLAIMMFSLLLTSCENAENLDESFDYGAAPAYEILEATPEPEDLTEEESKAEDLLRRDPIIISPQQAEEMMQLEGIIILDVRSQLEFDSGHIENAVLLPYNEISTLAAAILTDKSQTILIYCRAGRRSNIAAWALADLGYIAVYDFGGIEDWHGPIIAAGHPGQTVFNYIGALPEAVTYPFSFTTTQMISTEGPELIFTIQGYANRTYRCNFDKTRFWPYYNYSIHAISIEDTDGSPLQEITGLNAQHHVASEANMYGLFFDDFNFDGYLDMSLWAYPGGTMRNAPSYFWLWDRNGGLFVQNECLMNISWSASVYANHGTRQIEAFTRGGFALYEWRIYEYHDGQYIAVSFTSHELNDNEPLKWRVTKINHITGDKTITYRVEEIEE